MPPKRDGYDPDTLKIIKVSKESDIPSTTHKKSNASQLSKRKKKKWFVQRKQSSKESLRKKTNADLFITIPLEASTIQDNQIEEELRKKVKIRKMEKSQEAERIRRETQIRKGSHLTKNLAPLNKYPQRGYANGSPDSKELYSSLSRNRINTAVSFTYDSNGQIMPMKKVNPDKLKPKTNPLNISVDLNSPCSVKRRDSYSKVQERAKQFFERMEASKQSLSRSGISSKAAYLMNKMIQKPTVVEAERELDDYDVTNPMIEFDNIEVSNGVKLNYEGSPKPKKSPPNVDAIKRKVSGLRNKISNENLLKYNQSNRYSKAENLQFQSGPGLPSIQLSQNQNEKMSLIRKKIRKDYEKIEISHPLALQSLLQSSTPSTSDANRSLDYGRNLEILTMNQSPTSFKSLKFSSPKERLGMIQKSQPSNVVHLTEPNFQLPEISNSPQSTKAIPYVEPRKQSVPPRIGAKYNKIKKGMRNSSIIDRRLPQPPIGRSVGHGILRKNLYQEKS